MILQGFRADSLRRFYPECKINDDQESLILANQKFLIVIDSAALNVGLSLTRFGLVAGLVLIEFVVQRF